MVALRNCEIKPYDRQPEDTDKSWVAFCIYLKLGPERTIPKTVEVLGKTPGYKSVIEQWSRKKNWVARCRVFDAEEEAKTRELVRLERRHDHIKKIHAYRDRGENLGNALHNQAVAILNIVQEQLKTLARENMTVFEVKGLAEAGLKTIELSRKLQSESLGLAKVVEYVDQQAS